MKPIVLTVAVLLLSPQFVSAETVLFDSQGFENYSLGAMTNGQEGWTFLNPATFVSQIEDLGDGTYEKVMHVYNGDDGKTGGEYQVFDEQTTGELTISFDMKASTVAGRTLVLQIGNGLTLGSTSDGLAAYVCWGQESGEIRYLKSPTAMWTDLMTIDTQWHHVDMVFDLDNKIYDFNLDGGSVELDDAAWFSSAASLTSIDRVMLTAWGNSATDADFMVDNLVISQVPEPSTLVLLGVAFGGLGLVWRRRRG